MLFFTRPSKALLSASMLLFVAFTARAEDSANILWLETLDLSKVTAGSGKPQALKSIDGNPIRLAGVTYSHGVGTHAVSRFQISLHGAATHLESVVGLDDEKKGQGSITWV